MLDDIKIRHQFQLQWILIAILAGALTLLGFRIYYMTAQIPTASPLAPTTTPEEALPHYQEITEVLNPLVYSGVTDLMKDDTAMRIDFSAKSWMLTNIHTFDHQGNILLEEDRYGLCGELAAHVYKKIVPFLSDQYDVRFLKVSESGFFLRPNSIHIALVLIDRATGERYFIDPSFKRYGKEDDFKDYLFLEVTDIQTHLKSLTKDVVFPIDVETPLLIRKDFLLCLGVESIDGKFDRDNFALAMTANRRHDYSGRYIFTLRRQKGKTETFEDKQLLSQLLSPEELQRIIAKATDWFNAAVQSGG